jgi:hypothetical protein
LRVVTGKGSYISPRIENDVVTGVIAEISGAH